MYSGVAVELALRGTGAAHPGRERAAAGLRDVGSTGKQPQSPVEGPEIPAVLDAAGTRS